MKTVIVVFSKDPATDDVTNMKRYTFKSKDDIQTGDILETTAYNSKLVVMEIKDGSPDESKFAVRELILESKSIAICKITNR
jgi:hypothetical protein